MNFSTGVQSKVGGTFNRTGKRRTGADDILVRHHIIHSHGAILFHPIGMKSRQWSTKDEHELTYQGNPSSSSGSAGSAALPLPFSEVEKRGRSASTISTSSSDAIASRRLSMKWDRQREARVAVTVTRVWLSRMTPCRSLNFILAIDETLRRWS